MTAPRVVPALRAVVVAYNAPAHLQRFFQSWQQFAPPSAHLTVWDNDPGGPDTPVIELFRKRLGFRYHESPDNIGYARALNVECSISDGDIFLCLNADTELTPHAIGRCVDAMNNNYDWGILGPRQVDRARRLTAPGIIGTNTKPEWRGFREFDTGQWQDINTEAIVVNGSVFFIQRRVFDELAECPIYQNFLAENGLSETWGCQGAFLPTHLYFEETWACYHARAHGYKTVFYGPVTMIHDWHASISQTGEGTHYETSARLFAAACNAHDIDHDHHEFD